MINMRIVDQADLHKKTVLLRVDFNVPIKEGVVTSNFRIFKALNTIKYLLDSGAKVVLVSHLGRPKGVVDSRFSLKPVVEELERLLFKKVAFHDGSINSEEINNCFEKYDIVMLENIRFFEGETKNEQSFVKKLADIADVFVNDAFGTMHRKHASSYGVAKILPSYAGFLVFEETYAARTVLESPSRPVTLILGGAKVSDKITVIESFLERGVDRIIVGGAMAFTFIKAMGGNIGKSIVETDKIDYCKHLIKKISDQNIKFLLPVDVKIAKSIEASTCKITGSHDIPKDYAGFDIGPETIKTFSKQIKRSSTVIWNGPMGVFESDTFSSGTMKIIKAISKAKGYKFVGGGDSVSAIQQYSKKLKIDHISTGGGASMEILSGKQLPGLEVLKK